MITFIGDMILKLMLRSSGEKVNESLGGKMKVWEEKYVMGEYIPHPLTPSPKMERGNVNNGRNSKRIYKEDFYFYRHCEEPLKNIIGFVRSQDDAPVRLRLSNLLIRI